MANNIIEMDSLKESAVRGYSGMTVVFPQFTKEETLDVSKLVPKFNGCYAMNNSTVCFVSNNEVFITPYEDIIERSLCSAGFREEDFWVPFSNGDYPKNEQKKWKDLCEVASQYRRKRNAEACVSYCDKHHIGTIRKETLENCFEIPVTGVKVKIRGYETYHYPCVNFDGIVDYATIGHFCANNGKVVFVYRDGKTYVAKGYKIMEELRAAGYTERNMWVPLSNGEQILDNVLKECWDSIKKN